MREPTWSRWFVITWRGRRPAHLFIRWPGEGQWVNYRKVI